MIFVLLTLGSVAALLGVLPLPPWTILVMPAICSFWAVSSYLNEAPGYDMPGLSLYVGALFAAGSILFWVIGRGAALLVRKLASS